MSHEQFVGIWRLVSVEVRVADGVIYPYGENAVGRIQYSPLGRMSVQLMRRDRPAFAVEDLLAVPAETARAAIAGYVAYFGTYEVDEAAHVVHHHIEGSVRPDWVGTVLSRRYAFAGARLFLSTEPYAFGGTVGATHLIWEREE